MTVGSQGSGPMPATSVPPVTGTTIPPVPAPRARRSLALTAVVTTARPDKLGFPAMAPSSFEMIDRPQGRRDGSGRATVVKGHAVDGVEEDRNPGTGSANHIGGPAAPDHLDDARSGFHSSTIFSQSPPRARRGVDSLLCRPSVHQRRRQTHRGGQTLPAATCGSRPRKPGASPGDPRPGRPEAARDPRGHRATVRVRSWFPRHGGQGNRLETSRIFMVDPIGRRTPRWRPRPRAISSSVSSGKTGRARTSALACSATGQSPSRYPSSPKHGWRWRESG